jgi:histidinol dehydrogenase
MTTMLRRVKSTEIARLNRPPVDDATLDAAREIVAEVREGGEAAVRRYAERFGERTQEQPLVLGRAEIDAAVGALPADDRAVLKRAAARIDAFARAQRDAIRDIEVAVPGGRAGHTVVPVQAAGCYAPGGRYPLPSSALMTAVTARVAGCERVTVATPGAHPVTVAAAGIAGADAVLAVGGAHGIAALAHGFEGLEPVDLIAGPGNRWVTASKQLVSGVVGIDMLAGPSELLVIADDNADPATVAADLLAQAEHDTDARPILVCRSEAFASSVDAELARQLETLSTTETARVAVANGFACICESDDEMVAVSDRVAPEHLEILTANADELAGRLRHAGALFIGAGSAEVMGDYGVGPNHTLPTGGTARFRAGLSVMDFLRPRSWLRLDTPDADLVRDTVRLAEMEGLAGHAASARRRG